jgi:hypothetical protein
MVRASASCKRQKSTSPTPINLDGAGDTHELEQPAPDNRSAAAESRVELSWCAH